MEVKACKHVPKITKVWSIDHKGYIHDIHWVLLEIQSAITKRQVPQEKRLPIQQGSKYEDFLLLKIWILAMMCGYVCCILSMS
jgi:hypothetical protein